MLRMNGWQPIKTAPRDGTPILGFVSDKWIEGMCWAHEAWHYLSDGDEIPFGLSQPRYWMPLPEPPRKETAEEARLRHQLDDGIFP